MELHYVGISAAFDPYAQARPVGRCAECGAALYDGDRVYYGRGTDHVLGCGQCIDAGFAREEQPTPSAGQRGGLGVYPGRLSLCPGRLFSV